MFLFVFISAADTGKLYILYFVVVISAALCHVLVPAAWQRNAQVDHAVPSERGVNVVEASLVVRQWKVMHPREVLIPLPEVRDKTAWQGNAGVDHGVQLERAVHVIEVALVVQWGIGLRVRRSIRTHEEVHTHLPVVVRSETVDQRLQWEIGQVVRQQMETSREVLELHRPMGSWKALAGLVILQEIGHCHAAPRERREVCIIPASLAAQWKTDLTARHHSMAVGEVRTLRQAQLLCSEVVILVVRDDQKC